MKQLISAALFLFVLTLTACSTQSPTQGTAPAPPESFVMLDEGVWPENIYTEGLAVPPGTVDWAALDTENGYCSIHLMGLTDEEYNTYMELLQQDGFSVVEEISEEIKGQNYVSIGTILSDQDKALSISYIPDNLSIYISLIAEPDV